MSSQLCLLAALLCFINGGYGFYKKIAGCPFISREVCDSQYVKFYLQTRETKGEYGEFIRFQDDGHNNLTDSNYNPQKRSVVIIHGYTNSPKHYGMQRIKEEYLKREEMNVWFLDWNALTHDSCYLSSVYNIDYVGKCLAEFVNALGRPDLLHVIGFSLGGHVAALAANHLKPYLIPRITGLDPALPLFIGIAHQQRLSPDDGEFVDVIHTNAFFLGNFLPMGHVDFFVNGGANQPGCGGLFRSIACSHQRAPILFAESINSRPGFWGWPCQGFFDAIQGKCQVTKPFHIMGDPVSNMSSGLMYVNTKVKAPFAIGKPMLLDEGNSVERI